MLNYQLHMESGEVENLEFEIRRKALSKNPFPGLRPFTVDECHLYFGRESQIDEVLMKLSDNKFVTVLGFSGSGKSSLMYCGLIPVLLGGFMTEVGPSWNIVTTRPGVSPIYNLAESLLSNDPEYINATEEEKLINRTVTASILRSGTAGFLDLAKRYKLTTGSNLLILVDQFEELFRYRSDENIDESRDETALFVNMIIEAARNFEVPVYIALTMRSDYIGDCSLFAGLTELINESNYLIPQMSRDQLRMVIEGPVAVGGGKISERLVKRLLNDIGDGQDQLPILQHSLMRAWDYWVKNRDTTEPIDIRHYNAIGRIQGALSQHANEVFEELDDRQKDIAEVLFKTLTEKTGEDSGARRPASIIRIAEIAGVKPEEVIPIAEKFREPGRSFIMPTISTPLTKDTIIELSHESLMRIWTRLKQWVDEEYESAEMYMRLSEAAAMYQIGRTGLWRPPDLQLALNWQKKQRPTRAWAQRYDEAFERAIVFLDTSRITYEAEQRNQELMQKRLIKRTRAVAAILGFAAIIAIGFFIYAVTQQIEAENQRDLAISASIEAVESGIRANDNVIQASYQRLVAQRNFDEAERQRAQAEENFRFAQQQRRIAERQTEIAIDAKEEAEEARQEAEDARDLARQEYLRAETNFQEAQRLLFLSIAQSMSVKSLQVTDNDLKGLLAQHAYIFNTDYQGKEYDNYIYDGLYNALSQIKGDNYNEFTGHRNASTRSVAFGKNGNYVYSTGSDGKVLRWTISSLEAGFQVIHTNNHPNRKLLISPDNKWLVNSSDSSYIQVINLNALTSDPIIVRGHNELVIDMEFVRNENVFYSLDNAGIVRKYDFNQGSQVWHRPQLKSIAISPDGTQLAGGTLNGELVLYDINTGNERVAYHNDKFNPVHAIRYSQDGDHIAFGGEDGIVRVYATGSNTITNQLTGNTSRVNEVRFSPDNKMLASASYDGSVQVWVMENLDDLPIRMNDHQGYVWDLSFSPDSRYIITGTSGGIIKLWPVNPELFAHELCDLLERNMSEREWERYVGNDIDYQLTCKNREGI